MLLSSFAGLRPFQKFIPGFTTLRENLENSGNLLFENERAHGKFKEFLNIKLQNCGFLIDTI